MTTSPLSPTPHAWRFPTRIHRLNVADRTIDLVAPVDPDTLLDDAITEARYKADNYLPYWPIIWPSGLMLAARILTENASPPLPPTPHPALSTQDSELSTPHGARAIDLGCGLGLAGIAAALRGWHILLTDYDPEAIEFARHNALRNGVPPQRIRAQHMDWRAPVSERFPWVIASDVLYERRLHPLILTAVDRLLAEDGVAWVSDPQRTAAENFPLAAVEQGFHVETVNLEGESFSGGRQQGQLYILRRAS